MVTGSYRSQAEMLVYVPLIHAGLSPLFFSSLNPTTLLILTRVSKTNQTMVPTPMKSLERRKHPKRRSHPNQKVCFSLQCSFSLLTSSFFSHLNSVENTCSNATAARFRLRFWIRCTFEEEETPKGIWRQHSGFQPRWKGSKLCRRREWFRTVRRWRGRCKL